MVMTTMVIMPGDSPGEIQSSSGPGLRETKHRALAKGTREEENQIDLDNQTKCDDDCDTGDSTTHKTTVLMLQETNTAKSTLRIC